MMEREQTHQLIAVTLSHLQIYMNRENDDEN
jgi:hypothetical protein